jgi:NADPH:quinone reductase-like Zn-dependent oxidoreductase
MTNALDLPSTMRAWQFSSTKGGLEKNLELNNIALPKPKATQHLVQIIAVALNPVDYKPAEIPIIGHLIVPNPATPGLDFAGRIVIPATDSPFKAGDLVFGVAGTGSPIIGGALAEYALVGRSRVVAIPNGVDPVDAATLGVAGLTAYQSIIPKVKNGDRIFINGGSGGTGCFGIQFAKAAGCHVTTSCSTPNIELCKSLGADAVIDYTQTDLIGALTATSQKFDHAVDNVGKDSQLFFRCHEFLKPDGVLVGVGGEPSWQGLKDTIKRKILPGFLGGMKGKSEGFWPLPKPEDLAQAVEWMREGKVKAVIDSKFAFEDTPNSFVKLKTGRAKGKIVVSVSEA